MVRAGLVGGAAVERGQIEDAAEQKPRQRQVADYEGGGGLADVPKGPGRAVGLREGVVFVEDGGKDLPCVLERLLRWSEVTQRPTVKLPNAKTPHSTIFCLSGIWDWINIGIGIRIIMMSDEMLKTAFVIRWCMAVEHCALSQVLVVRPFVQTMLVTDNS